MSVTDAQQSRGDATRETRPAAPRSSLASTPQTQRRYGGQTLAVDGGWIVLALLAAAPDSEALLVPAALGYALGGPSCTPGTATSVAPR